MENAKMEKDVKKGGNIEHIYKLNLKATGRKLKMLRTIAGIKAVDILKEYPLISQSMLSRIENGEMTPNLSLLKFYSIRFGLKIDDLLVFEMDSENANKALDIACQYLLSNGFEIS